MPEVYDIAANAVRAVTQADVDRWENATAAFGLLLRYLQQSGQSVAAALAVEVAQGRATAADAEGRFAALLEIPR